MRFSKLKLVVALPLFLGIVACDRNSVDQEQSEDQVDIGNSPELQAQDKITSKSISSTLSSTSTWYESISLLYVGVKLLWLGIILTTLLLEDLALFALIV